MQFSSYKLAYIHKVNYYIAVNIEWLKLRYPRSKRADITRYMHAYDIARLLGWLRKLSLNEVALDDVWEK